MIMVVRAPQAVRLTVRWLAVGVLVGAVLACFAISHATSGGTVALIRHIVEVLRSAGFVGAVAFAIFTMAVASSGALPASLVAVAAGAVYGLGPGFLLTGLGNLLGAGLAFALSRWLWCDSAGRWIARHELVRRIDAAVSKDGWKVVCLLRLSPLMPFSATSYLLGVSSVRAFDYAAGTFASLLPLFAYVCLGSIGDAGLLAPTVGADPMQSVLMGIGAVATLVAIVHVSRQVLERRLARPLEDLDRRTAQ